MVPIILRSNNKKIRLYGQRERNIVITNTVDGRIKPVDTLVVNFNIVSMDGYHTFNIVDAQLRETFRLSKRSIDLSALGSSRSRPYLFRIRRIRRHFDRSESHSRHWYLWDSKGPSPPARTAWLMTAFGWGRGESTGSSDKIDQASSFHTSLAEDKCDLLLEQFIDFDANGHAKRSAKKKRIWAWGILKTTTKHYGLRYESGLLWKTDDQKLPNNYSQRNKICQERRPERSLQERDQHIHRVWTRQQADEKRNWQRSFRTNMVQSSASASRIQPEQTRKTQSGFRPAC